MDSVASTCTSDDPPLVFMTDWGRERSGVMFEAVVNALQTAACCAGVARLPAASYAGWEATPPRSCFNFSHLPPPMRGPCNSSRLWRDATHFWFGRDIGRHCSSPSLWLAEATAVAAEYANLLPPAEACPEVADNETLVAHVRSGDIFSAPRPNAGYGQPALSYYMQAWAHSALPQLLVVTEDLANPVARVMRQLERWWPPPPHEHSHARPTHGVRVRVGGTWRDDLRILLCARHLLLSKSSLSTLLLTNPRLRSVYLPSQPGADTRAASCATAVYATNAPRANSWAASAQQQLELVSGPTPAGGLDASPPPFRSVAVPCAGSRTAATAAASSTAANPATTSRVAVPRRTQQPLRSAERRALRTAVLRARGVYLHGGGGGGGGGGGTLLRHTLLVTSFNAAYVGVYRVWACRAAELGYTHLAWLQNNLSAAVRRTAHATPFFAPSLATTDAEGRFGDGKFGAASQTKLLVVRSLLELVGERLEHVLGGGVREGDGGGGASSHRAETAASDEERGGGARAPRLLARVWFSDADVYFVQPPWPHLPSCEYAFQAPGYLDDERRWYAGKGAGTTWAEAVGEGNTGLHAFANTPSMRAFLGRVIDSCGDACGERRYGADNDQQLFWAEARATPEVSREWCPLPPSLFPTGRHVHNAEQLDASRHVAWHANFRKGIASKLEAMRQAHARLGTAACLPPSVSGF